MACNCECHRNPRIRHAIPCCSTQVATDARLLEIANELTPFPDGYRWLPIDTAPKDGTHILVAAFDGSLGFGYVNGKKQVWHNVVHWFEDGWYGSVYGGDQSHPFTHATHWHPLYTLATPPTPESRP